jgi:hypothetical protein
MSFEVFINREQDGNYSHNFQTKFFGTTVNVEFDKIKQDFKVYKANNEVNFSLENKHIEKHPFETHLIIEV